MKTILYLIFSFALGHVSYHFFFKTPLSPKKPTVESKAQIPKPLISPTTEEINSEKNSTSEDQKRILKIKKVVEETLDNEELSQTDEFDETHDSNKVVHISEEPIEESEIPLEDDLSQPIPEKKKKNILERLFSKKSYPWVKKISGQKRFKSEKNSLSLYPWGSWVGLFSFPNGEKRSMILKLKQKKHPTSDYAQLNLKVGKNRNLHLSIKKSYPLLTPKNDEFLNRYDYFSFQLDKDLLMVLFKKKRHKTYKGLFKLKNDKKTTPLATFKLKKRKKNL